MKKIAKPAAAPAKAEPAHDSHHDEPTADDEIGKHIPVDDVEHTEEPEHHDVEAAHEDSHKSDPAVHDDAPEDAASGYASEASKPTDHAHDVEHSDVSVPSEVLSATHEPQGVPAPADDHVVSGEPEHDASTLEPEHVTSEGEAEDADEAPPASPSPTKEAPGDDLEDLITMLEGKHAIRPTVPADVVAGEIPDEE